VYRRANDSGLHELDVEGEAHLVTGENAALLQHAVPRWCSESVLLMVASECEEKAIVSPGLQEFLDSPDVVCDSRLHGRRDAQGLMNAAEVEEGHVEVHGGFKMLNCFAESEAQARKATQMRPHAQIGAFDVRGANARFVRVSTDNDWNGCRDFRRLIPLWPFSVIGSVQLDELSEINICSKIFFDGGNVTAESIGRKLKSPDDSFAQVSDEVIGTHPFALGDKVGQNHFRVAINRHPNVRVTPFCRRAGTDMTLFGVNERPEFIGLNESRTDAAHPVIEEIAAVLSNRKKQRENRALMCASYPRHGANAHSFEQERGDLGRFVGIRVVPSKRPLARLRKCGITARAAVTLDSLPSVKSESLRFVMLASQAGHGLSLVFLREKPENEGLGFRLGLSPRLDSSLPPVRAGGREFCSSPHSTPVNICHAVRVKGIERLSVGRSSFYESVSRLNQSGKGCVKHGEWVRISAYIHAVVCKGLHYICRSESDALKRHKNLAAQFGEASGRGHAIIICQRLKLLNRLLQKGNPLSHKNLFGLPLLKLLFRSHVAGLVRVYVNVSHDRENVSWPV
jgi:hypothetical protein